MLGDITLTANGRSTPIWQFAVIPGQLGPGEISAARCRAAVRSSQGAGLTRDFPCGRLQAVSGAICVSGPYGRCRVPADGWECPLEGPGEWPGIFPVAAGQSGVVIGLWCGQSVRRPCGACNRCPLPSDEWGAFGDCEWSGGPNKRRARWGCSARRPGGGGMSRGFLWSVGAGTRW